MAVRGVTVQCSAVGQLSWKRKFAGPDEQTPCHKEGGDAELPVPRESNSKHRGQAQGRPHSVRQMQREQCSSTEGGHATEQE